MNIKLSTKFLSIFFATCLTLGSAQAKLVQILHTNDTHSFLDGSTHDSNTGGTAKLKALIDYFKDRGNRDGMKSIVLDAGDFLEGNLYYMADQGMKSFEAHNNVGYDMVALGNHDYLMGAEELDKMLAKIDLNFAFLAANVWVSPKYSNIRNKIQPFKEIEIDGIKIAVLGLTTKEFYYSWRLENSQITDPYQAALTYEDILKKRKNDFIIALTHIGVTKDKKLARKTSGIDLIVGGHSHTLLDQVVYEENQLKRKIPIVQAGKHIEFLGRLVVDLEKGKPLKVVSYELVPVKYVAEDGVIKNIIEEANKDLDAIYGEAWLKEKIGHSDLKGDDPSGSRKWAYFISDAIREKAKADISIHAPPMNGENFPVGDITRRDVLNSIPRVFDLKEITGWSIYTARIKGIWLRTVFDTLASFGEPLAYSGIQMKYIKTPFGIKVGKATINGKPIRALKYYNVAFTEGIVRGAGEISSKTRFILNFPKKTPYKIWQTLQDKIISQGNRLRSGDISELNHTFYYPDLEAE